MIKRTLCLCLLFAVLAVYATVAESATKAFANWITARTEAAKGNARLLSLGQPLRLSQTLAFS